MELLSPKLDIVFKKMFGDKNNSDMLRDLVNAYLGVDITGTFELTNTEITPVELENKFARLDLKVSTMAEEIDIEVQVANKPDYNDRTIYYWATLYASTVGRGEEYGTAKNVMSLNILDFNMFNCEDFNTNFTFSDLKNGITLSDKARISFIELPKVRERAFTPEQIASDARIAWATFFNSSKEEDFNMLNQTTQNPNVQKAVTIIRNLSSDKDVLAEVKKREEALENEKWILGATRRDALAEGEAIGLTKGRAEGEAIGLTKGRAEGEAEGMSKMADALRAMGMDEGDIKEVLLRAQSEEPEQPVDYENEYDEDEDEDEDWEP